MPVAVAAKMMGHSVTLFTETFLADRNRGALLSSRDGKHTTTRSSRVNNGQP